MKPTISSSHRPKKPRHRCPSACVNTHHIRPPTGRRACLNRQADPAESRRHTSSCRTNVRNLALKAHTTHSKPQHKMLAASTPQHSTCRSCSSEHSRLSPVAVLDLPPPVWRILQELPLVLPHAQGLKHADRACHRHILPCARSSCMRMCAGLDIFVTRTRACHTRVRNPWASQLHHSCLKCTKACVRAQVFVALTRRRHRGTRRRRHRGTRRRRHRGTRTLDLSGSTASPRPLRMSAAQCPSYQL
jgi:hypothetical protein